MKNFVKVEIYKSKPNSAFFFNEVHYYNDKHVFIKPIQIVNGVATSLRPLRRISKFWLSHYIDTELVYTQNRKKGEKIDYQSIS